jgi:hypothetical protein
MQLKVKIKTTHFVDYKDIDAFISHHMGRSFECVAAEEWGNDTDKSMEIDGNVNAFDRRDVEAFKGGTHNGSFLTRQILEVLCADGKLPSGNYTIRVSW